MANHSKIAIITSVHNALDGRIFQKEARALATQGYQISLIAPNSLGSAQTIESAGILFEGLSPSNKRSGRPALWLQIIKLLWKNRNQYEIWHIHDPELLLICVPLRLIFAKHTKLVYDVHEDYSAAVRSKTWIPLNARTLVSYITHISEQILAKFCSLIIAATPKIAENFKSSKRRPVIVVHNYPILGSSDKDAPAPQLIKNQTIRCVYAGALSSIRGTKEIIEAFELMSEHPVELLLAGPFESTHFQKECLETAPPNVTYLGILPWDEIPELLATCDIGMLCLLPAPNYLHCLPTKLFEYLYAGLAVVASDFDYWNTFILEKKTGIQVNPASPESIAQGVLSLVGNQELRQDLRLRGPLLVANEFAWESQIPVLFEAYDNLT